MKIKFLFPVFLSFAFIHSIFAQSHVRHLENYDEKLFHFGFVVGLNQTWFNMKTNDNYNGSSFIAHTKVSTGFSVGLSAALQPNELLAIRFSPTAVFGQRAIDFQDYATGTTTSKVVESTTAEFPLLLKIKSYRRHNGRMFMLVGIKPSFSLASKSAKEEERIRVSSTDVAIEYGFGFEKFNEMFKFAPEIRFSHGLKNVLQLDENIYSQQIGKLTNHSVSLYLFFE